MTMLRSCGLFFLATIAALPSSPATQEPLVLQSTRDLKIDAAENELSPITFIGVAPNGTIALMQHQDATVRFFNARGTSLGTFGRKGQGPGEFDNPGKLAWVGDTLIVSDIGTWRFTLIAADRKLIKTVPWVTSVAPSSRSGSQFASLRISQARFPHADGSQLVLTSFSEEIPAWLGGGKPGTLFLHVDASGALRRVVARTPPSVGCTVSVSVSGGFEGTRIPYCSQPLEDVAANGSRVVLAYTEAGKTEEYRVLGIKSTGDTVFARTIAYRAQRVPRTVRDSVRSRLVGSNMPSKHAAADRIPETYPPLSRILAGLDATTWLEMFTKSGNRTWHVLDAQGNLAGRLTVPRNIDVKVASREAIWATETDDDGLQHVVRFKLRR